MGEIAMNMRITLFLAGITAAASVNSCPGEGARYGDFKCNHDPTHRVCAKLKDGSGNKVMWGNKDFWQLTGQSDWSSSVGSAANNPGGDWCICMWATASLISQVGCESVHIDCGATDTSYMMQKYTDSGQDLTSAKNCLHTKCGTAIPGSGASQSQVQMMDARELNWHR